MRRFVLAPVDGQRRGVDTDGHRGRPIGVHLPVFVMETLQLQFQVVAPDQRLMDRLFQMEHVVADGEVVLEPKRSENDAVPNWKC